MRVWVASLLFYITIYAFCELLRYIVSKYVQKDSYAATILNELIGTVQICAPMFDVNFVLANYGLRGVLIEIAFIELCNAILIRDAMADPCPLIMGWSKGNVSSNRLFSILSVQFTAAYLSYIIARLYWSIGLHPMHSEILTEERCEADLTVAIIYGSLVEAIGTFAGKASEVFLEERLVNPKVVTVVQSFMAGLITILGIGLTGMYGNPIVAWACTFNCGDVPHLSHFIVYWIAPLVAWKAADRFLHSNEEEKKEVDAKKEE